MIHTDTGDHTPVTSQGGSGISYSHIWYLKDYLGNNRVLADGSGNAVAFHDYDPYGEEIAVASSSLPYPLPPGAKDSPYLYGGKEWSETTSTYDFEARYLSPSFHRFTTMDPLAEKYYSISPYAYCANNPVRFVDPAGLWHWDTDGNLIWDKYDNIETLSSFLNVSFDNACQIVYRNTPEFLVLNEGYTIYRNNIWIEEKESTTVTVNNTIEAGIHYRRGNGEVADVGDSAIDAVVGSTTFQNKLEKISTQEVATTGDFSVDITARVFHIGRTNVKYSLGRTPNSETVAFEIFANDGFWDPNFIKEKDGSKNASRHPDGPGPNLEMGGTPYRYGVRTRTYFFKPKKP